MDERIKIQEHDSDFDNHGDEWDSEDSHEYTPPSDFTYVSDMEKKKEHDKPKLSKIEQMVENAKKATQPSNSVFIGTAIKQMKEKEAEERAKKGTVINKKMPAPKVSAKEFKNQKIAANKTKIDAKKAKIAAMKQTKQIAGTIGEWYNPVSWIGAGKNYQSMTALDVGLDYIKKFHEANDTDFNKYLSSVYKTMGTSKAQTQINALGNAIQILDLSESDVKSIASALADEALGQVPAKVSDFLWAINKKVTSTPFVDFAVAVSETAPVKAVQRVGDVVIKAGETTLDVAESATETAKFASGVNKFLPWVAPIAIGFVVYKILTSKWVQEVSKDVIKARLGVR